MARPAAAATLQQGIDAARVVKATAWVLRGRACLNQPAADIGIECLAGDTEAGEGGLGGEPAGGRGVSSHID